MRFGDRLKAARGKRSLVDVAYDLRSELPEPLWVRADTLRRMENGETPEEKASPVLVAALARVYDVPIADLSEFGERAFGMIRELAVRSRWPVSDAA